MLSDVFGYSCLHSECLFALRSLCLCVVCLRLVWDTMSRLWINGVRSASCGYVVSALVTITVDVVWNECEWYLSVLFLFPKRGFLILLAEALFCLCLLLSLLVHISLSLFSLSFYVVLERCCGRITIACR